jgi:hypothetical protein
LEKQAFIALGWEELEQPPTYLDLADMASILAVVDPRYTLKWILATLVWIAANLESIRDNSAFFAREFPWDIFHHC